MLSLFITIRPAAESGLSSHVFNIGPPYTSTLHLTHPCADISASGLILRHGKSVCAAVILKLPPSHFSPIENAASVESKILTKYLPSFFIVHFSERISSSKPLSFNSSPLLHTIQYEMVMLMHLFFCRVHLPLYFC